MKNVNLLIAAVTILSAFAFTIISAINWKVKEEYSVKSGIYTFKGLKAQILFDEEYPEKSKIAATIDAKTISTGNSLQNSHAKEALGADKYPVIVFMSTAIKKISPSRYEATGNLTLKGVTKEIKIPFTFDSKKNVMDRFPMVTKETFYGTFTIVPKDFNVTRMGTPESVTVELDIPVTQ